ncbi:MAG: flagellar filament capping protein FliD [Deltaproteobacteria bacterium]|nr:flagellar filament capping protein FliD [Deltaproteobacteria bacterium]
MPTITFAGLASGIDTDSIIKATVDARRTAIIPLENEVKRNESETDSLEEFNTKLLALQDALKGFMTLNGGGISKTGTSSNPEAVSISAGSGALTSSTKVSVTSLASAATFSFNDRFSSYEEPLVPNLAGEASIDIAIGSGESAKTVSIAIDKTTTLSELANKINENSDIGISSSIINTSTEEAPQYALLISGLKSGTEAGLLQVSVASAITSEGIFQSSTLEQASDARFNVSGLGDISRSSNIVSDLLPGVTFELKQANASGVMLSVQEDVDATVAKFQTVIDAYNELIKYAREESKVEQDTDEEGEIINVFGSLARNSIDERAISELKSAIATANSGIADSEVQIFADLGVTTARDGTLDFDSEKFREGMGKSPEAVEKLLNTLGDTVAGTNGTISQYTKYQGLIDVAVDANKRGTENLNEKIARIERNIDGEVERLRRIFTNLETTMSKLNSGANAIASILQL